jgi:hypothetical protein
VISKLLVDKFGACIIISLEIVASNVLVFELLQQECHVKKPLCFVALFEKFANLEATPITLARFF